MKIGVYQFAPEFGKKENNLKRIEETLRKTDADLVVLPELCTTGYQIVSQEEMQKSYSSVGVPTARLENEL